MIMKKSTVILIVGISATAIITYYLPVICMMIGLIIGKGDSFGEGMTGIAIGESLRPIAVVFLIILTMFIRKKFKSGEGQENPE
ncbi:MAG: hypothetical protein ACMUJM_26160 [bacterium]